MVKYYEIQKLFDVERALDKDGKGLDKGPRCDVGPSLHYEDELFISMYKEGFSTFNCDSLNLCYL